jgi:hypothetical protein
VFLFLNLSLFDILKQAVLLFEFPCLNPLRFLGV